MIHFYYIILLILTSITTFYAPRLITRYNTYYTEIKRKRNETLRNTIKEEIKNVLLELKNEK
jgi:hypothetical protein